MAVVTVSVPDEVWAKYQKMDPDSPARAAEKQLVRFADAGFKERFMVLKGDMMSRLERAFGRPIGTAENLVSWVESAKTFEVGGVKISLTDGQIKRLSAEAEHLATTIENHLPKRVQDIFRIAIGS